MHMVIILFLCQMFDAARGDCGPWIVGNKTLDLSCLETIIIDAVDGASPPDNHRYLWSICRDAITNSNCNNDHFVMVTQTSPNNASQCLYLAQWDQGINPEYMARDGGMWTFQYEYGNGSTIWAPTFVCSPETKYQIGTVIQDSRFYQIEIKTKYACIEGSYDCADTSNSASNDTIDTIIIVVSPVIVVLVMVCFACVVHGECNRSKTNSSAIQNQVQTNNNAVNAVPPAPVTPEYMTWYSRTIRAYITINNWDNKTKDVFDDELLFYEKITKHWNNLCIETDFDELVQIYTKKYNNFMLDIVRPTHYFTRCVEAFNFEIFEKNKLFHHDMDINIVFFWRVHMLHPVLYAKDCKERFGFLLSPPFHEFVTNGTVLDFDPLYSNVADSVFTKFDFSISVRKNLTFMQRIIEDQRCEKKDYMKHMDEFADYMSYKRTFERSKIHLCPTLAVDFVWHSHMMFPVMYNVLYSKADHDDLVPMEQYKIYQSFSYCFWSLLQNVRISQQIKRYRVKNEVIGYAKKQYEIIDAFHRHKYELIGGFMRRHSSIPLVDDIMDVCFAYVDTNWLLYSFWDPMDINIPPKTPPPQPQPTYSVEMTSCC
eukprot:69179_1